MTLQVLCLRICDHIVAVLSDIIGNMFVWISRFQGCAISAITHIWEIYSTVYERVTLKIARLENACPVIRG